MAAQSNDGVIMWNTPDVPNYNSSGVNSVINSFSNGDQLYI